MKVVPRRVEKVYWAIVAPGTMTPSMATILMKVTGLMYHSIVVVSVFLQMVD